MTVLEFIIYLLKHVPLDGKIYVYCGDEEYHHEDYSGDDIWMHTIGDETRVYLS